MEANSLYRKSSSAEEEKKEYFNSLSNEIFAEIKDIVLGLERIMPRMRSNRFKKNPDFYRFPRYRDVIE